MRPPPFPSRTIRPSNEFVRRTWAGHCCARTSFMQNLLLYAAAVRATGTLPLPLGRARVAMIDARDVGRAAAIALTESGHEHRCYELYGADTVESSAATFDRIVEEIAPDAISVTLERGDEPRPSSPVGDADLDGYLELAKRAARYSVAAHLGRTRLPVVGPALLATAGRVLGRAKPRAIARALRRDLPFGPCEAGRLIAVLRPDGTVNACELLPGRLGNLRDVDYDFDALWRSLEADEVRDGIRATRCRCTHECYVNPTLVRHPLSLARALLGPTAPR